MSTHTETPAGEDVARTEEPGGRSVAVRTFAVDIATGKGRTIDLRVVPFGEVVTVADGLGGVPKGVPYQEEHLPGVYDRQVRAANRVLLNFEHEQGLRGIVGHGLELRQAADGYHGSFRVHETDDGDKALYLVDEGVLGGASCESWFQKSIRSASGVVQRVKAHLDAVALCRTPQYSGAIVTGRREAHDLLLDETDLPVPFDADLAARMAAIGLAVPEYLKAHPAAGTPDQSGTPGESGTRQDGHTTTELEER